MTDTVYARIEGSIGRITLNRPKALNALTTKMCVAITDALVAWESDPSIKAVLINGAGDRAFCAGGDVVMLHDSGKANGGRGDGRAEAFWRTEYALNELIHRYSKPYISLIDGIVMGGGVGLSVHGRYRVAGDTTLFAMPETGIGYFPDVGGTYFLPRLGKAVGNWLGLTGARLGSEACLELGIATHFVPTDQHEALIDALKSDGDVDETLTAFSQPLAEWPLPDAIEAFAGDSVADISNALSAETTDWAAQQKKLLSRKSPLAMAVTLDAMKRGGVLDFRAAMTQELDLSLNFLATQDFYEGIRAQLIDKDRNPQWSHTRIADVTKDHVERLFRQTATPPLEFLP